MQAYFFTFNFKKTSWWSSTFRWWRAHNFFLVTSYLNRCWSYDHVTLDFVYWSVEHNSWNSIVAKITHIVFFQILQIQVKRYYLLIRHLNLN